MSGRCSCSSVEVDVALRRLLRQRKALVRNGDSVVVVIMIDRYPGWKRVIQYRGKRGGGDPGPAMARYSDRSSFVLLNHHRGWSCHG